MTEIEIQNRIKTIVKIFDDGAKYVGTPMLNMEECIKLAKELKELHFKLIDILK